MNHRLLSIVLTVTAFAALAVFSATASAKEKPVKTSTPFTTEYEEGAEYFGAGNKISCKGKHKTNSLKYPGDRQPRRRGRRALQGRQGRGPAVALAGARAADQHRRQLLALGLRRAGSAVPREAPPLRRGEQQGLGQRQSLQDRRDLPAEQLLHLGVPGSLRQRSGLHLRKRQRRSGRHRRLPHPGEKHGLDPRSPSGHSKTRTAKLGTIAGGPGAGTIARGETTTYTCSHVTSRRLTCPRGSYSDSASVTGAPPAGDGPPFTEASNTVIAEVVV